MYIIYARDAGTKVVRRIECEAMAVAGALCVRLLRDGCELDKVELASGQQVTAAELTASLSSADMAVRFG